MANVAEVKSRGATVVLVANDGDEETARQADAVLWVPETEHLFAPIVDVVPLQLFAYSPGPAPRPRRRPSPQPGQGGHRRVSGDRRRPELRGGPGLAGGAAGAAVVGVGIDAVDLDRFRRGARPPAPAGRPPVHRRTSWPTPAGRRPGAPAVHPVRGQGGHHEGARRRPRGLPPSSTSRWCASGLDAPVLVLHGCGRRRWPAGPGWSAGTCR